MSVPGFAHRLRGATSHLSPSARFTLAAGLLVLGVGDLAVINLVLLPSHLAPRLATSFAPSPPPSPVAAAVDGEGASAASGDGGGRAGPEAPEGRAVVVGAAIDVAPDEFPTAPSVASEPNHAPPTATVVLAPSTDTGMPSGEFPDLHFARNTTWLSRPSRETLDGVVESLTESSGRRVVLSGHTDDVGPPDFNRALSLARAQRARRYLQARGIDLARIQIQGLGPAAPLQGEKLSEARARNRRVEIKVH